MTRSRHFWMSHSGIMKVTNIILSRPLFRFEGDDTNQRIIALKWQVIFESGNLVFQADEVSLVEIIPPMTQQHFKEVHRVLLPTLDVVQRHVDMHPELTRPSIIITQGDKKGYTLHDPLAGVWQPNPGPAAEPRQGSESRSGGTRLAGRGR